MKKLLILFIGILIFTNCAVQSTVSNSGIPTHYATITFYNGSLPIGEYKDVKMLIEVINTSTLLTSHNMEVYHIISKSVNDYIVDCQTLTYKYTLSSDSEN